MNRTSRKRWLKALDVNRPAQRNERRRLILTNLESRDLPSAFTPGDIVVYRVGTGSTVASGTTVPAFLDEYTPTGTLVQSIPLPTANSGSNLGLSADSAATTGTGIRGDGSLTDSSDGRYLLAVGYNVATGIPTTTTPPSGIFQSGSAASTAARVVAVVDSNGNINSSTGVTNYVANNIDDAASTDGEAIFTGGFDSPGGLRQTLIGTVGAATAINTGTGSFSNSNARIVSVDGSQLYGENSTTNIDGVFSTGTGLPTTSGQVSTILPGFPTTGSTGTPAQFPNPYQIIFDGPDTLYVADARTNGNGGLQKWSLSGGFWEFDYLVTGFQENPIANSAAGTSGQLYEGLIGVTGNCSSTNFVANPTFYATTAETTAVASTVPAGLSPTKLVTFTDTGSAANTGWTVLATAPANEAIRGVAFAPVPIGTTADTVGISTSPSNSVPTGTSVTFTATVTNGATGWITFEDTSTTPTTTLAVVPLSGNQAQFSTSTLSVGAHTIKAIYGGDTTYLANSNSLTQTVTGTNTTTVVTSNTALPTAAGVVVTFTATISPSNATGSVTFFDNGLPINATPISPTAGVATVTETTNPTQGVSPLFLTPGSHTITAVFTATGTFVTSSNAAAPLIQNVKPNAFGAGDLLVYRVGDGVNPLAPGGPTSNVVYIDEYTTAGGQTTPVQSIVMPTSSVTGGNLALTTTGQQSTEGQLSLSGNGEYVLITGYDEAPGGADPHTSAAATTPRTIGEISYNGTINTSMALTDLADGGSVRAVASPDGNQIYASGSTGGVRYVANYTPGLTTSTQVETGDGGINDLVVVGGQLYASSGTANSTLFKIATIGTGLPTTSGQTLTNLANIPTSGAPIEPEGFYFAHLEMGPTVGPDTLYIADNGDFADGTITKWALVSGAWNLVDTITSGAGSDNPSAPSYGQIAGTVNNGAVSLYVTYGNGGNNFGGPGDLFSITDTGGYNAAIPNHTATTLASVSSTSNETFRGVVQVPVAPEVASVVASDGVAADGTSQRSEVRQIAVTFSGPVTFAGGNSNAAAAFQLNQINNLTSHFNTPVAVNGLMAAVSTNGAGQTVVTLTFTATGNGTLANNTGPVDQVSAENGGAPSLNDGRFQLTILSSNVTTPTGPLAAGGLNGDYVSPLDTLTGGTGQVGLFRDFGDATGNGIVDNVDLGTLRGAFNSNSSNSTYLAYLDADNSGFVDNVDVGQFRSRFNTNVFQ